RGEQTRYSAARRYCPVEFDTCLSVPDGELAAKSIYGCAREPGRPRLAIQVPERRDKALLRQRVSVKREPANRCSASFGRPFCRHRLRHHGEQLRHLLAARPASTVSGTPLPRGASDPALPADEF